MKNPLPWPLWIPQLGEPGVGQEVRVRLYWGFGDVISYLSNTQTALWVLILIKSKN